MEQRAIKYLLEKHLSGTLNEVERRELSQIVHSIDAESNLESEIMAQLQIYGGDINKEMPKETAIIAVRDILAIDKSKGKGLETETPIRHISSFSRWGWVAASVAILIVMVTFMLRETDRSPNPSPQLAKDTTQILPGKEGAILTLADGTEVLLDTMQDNVLVVQGGATVKVVNGTLLYDNNGVNVVYNKMSTPKGRQFHVKLPDGTSVWLNSASSIRYPTVFASSERRVDITGEAYFEVAKNHTMPFIVNVNDRVAVRVLGTQFNVNAYKGETDISTTLIEGSVSVSMITANDEQVAATTLVPGQQAWVDVEENAIDKKIAVVNGADLEQIIAWKKGLFNFKDAGLETVMKQLERWYDIDVKYEGVAPNIVFQGKMDRGVNLSEVLEMLTQMKVKFRMEGRTLIVMNN